MASRVTSTLTLLAAPVFATSDNGTVLVTFDGSKGTTFEWHAENDPVMGGLSNSTFTVTDDVGVFDGEVKIVPSLQAPGFCFLHNVGSPKFNSAKGHSHVELTLRNKGLEVDFVTFKVSFAADTLDPQFKNFKADFNLTEDASDWTKVLVPFTDFTNSWNPATGEPKVTCAADPSVCMTEKDKDGIYQFGLWAEGKKGAFHVEIQSVRAVTPTSVKLQQQQQQQQATNTGTAADWNNTCTAEAQSSLRWNVSAAGFDTPLPYVPPGGLPADESFADAICCDPFFRPLAEPEYFFQQPDVDLFNKLDAKAETTFYDSVCGQPLFTAPRGRTFAEWKDESDNHGWPSFRDSELVSGSIIIDNATGFVYSSKCGTHLGSYFKDDVGDRYCLDLACISGSPPKE